MEDVKESVENIGLSTENLDLVKAALEEARLSCITIPYKKLDDEDVCRQLFQFVTKEPFDRKRWLNLKNKRIVCDIGNISKEVCANMHNIEKMYGKDG